METVMLTLVLAVLMMLVDSHHNQESTPVAAVAPKWHIHVLGDWILSYTWGRKYI